MKTMTCCQLGGCCEEKFKANTFDEIVEMSKKHAMEMFAIKDEAHLKAMNEMQQLMQDKDAMLKWYEGKKGEFLSLSED